MPDIDLKAALTEMIDGAVADPSDRVSTILNVGATDQNTTFNLRSLSSKNAIAP